MATTHLARCWCCAEPLGTCTCQDETTELCIGCNHCTQHCRCKKCQTCEDEPQRELETERQHYNTHRE
jgi:hypothetical protein